MTIHREGYKSIGIGVLLFLLLNVACFTLFTNEWRWLAIVILILSLLLLLFVISFFRVPKRTFTIDDNKIISPADGKVVVIEEITDEEYFKDRRLQLSVFMSPANVHLNRAPVTGKIIYNKYHKGKYLVAWHPKSSTENERHSVVFESSYGPLLVKQIAGALAKRISNYAAENKYLKQGEELGFIKFGSRVDVLLPPDAKIEVQMGQYVKAGVTVLASFEK